MADLSQIPLDDLMRMREQMAAPAPVAEAPQPVAPPDISAMPLEQLMALRDQMKPKEATPGLNPATAGIRQGMTFNFGDEIMAGMTTPIEMAIGAYKGTDAGKSLGQRVTDSYERGLAQERQLLKRAEAEGPGQMLAGNIAGGLVTGGALQAGGATLLKGGGSAASMIGRGAAEGALYGAASGAGEGEGAEDRAWRALKGAGVGGAAGGALGAVGGAMAGRNARAALPAADEIKAAGTAAYKAADDAGVIFKPQVPQGLAERAKAAAAEFGYHPENQPGVKVALDELSRIAAADNVTLKGMDTARKVVSGGYRPGNNSNNKLLSEIMENLDDSLRAVRSDDILTGDAKAGVAALDKARDLWSQSRKADALASAVKNAEERASVAGSGSNIGNTTRQEVKKLLKNARGYSEDEKAALARVVRGTPGQNLARLVGTLAPTGVVSGGAGMGIGAAIGSLLGPQGAAAGAAIVPQIGAIGRLVANRGVNNNVAMADALIRSGGNMPVAALSERQKALAQILTQQIGQQSPTQIRQR